MWGNPLDLSEIQKHLMSDKHPEDSILVSSVNKFVRTYDGIDVCAERLVGEIKEHIKIENSILWPEKISFVGYSAGGLIIRYAIGILHDFNFFDHVKPHKFITVATPHLGVRFSGETSIGPIVDRALPFCSNLYGGRSLQQLCLLDHDKQGHELLLELSTPSSRFIFALSLFEISFYANARTDRLVAYRTSSVSLDDPYKNLPYSSVKPIEGQNYIVRDQIQYVEINHMAAPHASLQQKQAPISALSVLSVILIVPFIVIQVLLFAIPMRVVAAFHQKSKNQYKPKVSSTCDEGAGGLALQVNISQDKNNSLRQAQHTSKQPQEDIRNIIHRNLISSIQFRRIDCWFPGNLNSHGKIVHRRGMSLFKEGREIVLNIVQTLK